MDVTEDLVIDLDHLRIQIERTGARFLLLSHAWSHLGSGLRFGSCAIDSGFA